MRVLRFLLASLLVATAGVAQEAAPASKSESPTTPLNLPISLDKIREGLAQPAPAEPLKGLNATDATTFHVDITEQQRIQELMATIKFEKPGPQVAGGIYAYDQYQRLFPRIDNPRVQPYGAFSTGEVMTLAVEALVEKYVVEKMAHVIGTALREQAEREAREEVARALANYWAARSAPAASPSPDSAPTTTPERTQ